MKRRSHIELQTAREVAEGKRQSKKNAKKMKASQKSPPMVPMQSVNLPPEPAGKPRHYTLSPIDPDVTYPKQVRKAGRVAQSYYEPEGQDAKLVALEKQLDAICKTVEGIW